MKGLEKILSLSNAAKGFVLTLLCFFVLQGLCSEIVWANTVNSRLAHKLVNGWLAKEARPMDSRLGSQVENVETFADANGQAVYYVVYLRPNGFVIVPADDLVEPVVCFSPSGSFDPSEQNPLGALVGRDLPARVNAARQTQKQIALSLSAGQLTKQQSAIRRSGEKALNKWNRLLEAADANAAGILMFSMPGISDVRVSPLLQSKWSQATLCSNACYNYYTPPVAEGSIYNYSCGCVATAVAQYMRFWQYPATGVGSGSFTVYVNGSPQTNYLRGGDGLGGPYSWTDMALVPDCGTTLVQRQAIGALTYDVGVASHMEYAAGGSGAYISAAAVAMVDTFGYSNAIYGYNNNRNFGAALNAMINPNLDWGNPVILGISNFSSGIGHAVVADGYGYNNSTLYHHLNIGWAGASDAWYNLPDIQFSSYLYDVVDTAIYNIYINGSGEIISGRVTAVGSNVPISGATVTAVTTGSETYQAVTNAVGIYALANVSSNSTCTISVAKPGYLFTGQIINTGKSQDSAAASGNRWAVDFALSRDDIAVPVIGSFNPAISGEVVFNARTDSNFALSGVYFCLRSPNGGAGVPIGYENMPADFNDTSGQWQCSFDTTQVSNGDYVILAISVDVNSNAATSNIVPVSIINTITEVSKCTVAAGRDNDDVISLSGTLNAAIDDISAADEIVVDINSTNMADHFVQAFPINSTTSKNSKFNSMVISKPFKSSFAFNPKTSKFLFSARNFDLSGLSCPLTVRIEIGDFYTKAEVNEVIVNGKKPIPINLLMGVKNSLRADKSRFTRDRNTGLITKVAVSGGFSVKDTSIDMAANSFSVTIGTKPFTMPAGKFKNAKGKFICSKVILSGGEIASAAFDFNKCTFTLTIKNTNFVADSGTADFGLEFGGFSEGAEVSLP